MAIEILMPALSPTMTEGNLAKWHKKEGDKVKPGDVIAEIETDKAMMEVEAADAGILGKIIVPDKTNGVKVNQLIAVLLEAGEDKSAIDQVIASHNSVTDSKKTSPVEAPKAAQEITAQAHAIPTSSTSSRIFATPLAKRIAAQRNINLSHITGSGPKGRIVKDDVLNANQGSSIGRASQEYTSIATTQMRRVIAKRLLESKQSVPHFYLSMDCNVNQLMETRDVINARAKVSDGKPQYKVSINDFVIKASAEAIRRIPAINSSWSDEAVIQYNNIDISVAVSVDDGLITPIIQNADQKSIVQISQEVKSLAARAKKNELKPQEFQGGGFTISNLGMYGVKEFKAIINPPQSSILGVGTIEERAVVKNGVVQSAHIMSISISSDHRVVDGVVAAQFMNELKMCLENPVLMFVGNL